MTEKIAIFGSAFNPPTRGHASVIEQLTHFDRVLLVPSYKHAWGKTMASFEQRCQWVDAFIHDLNMPQASCCRLEAELGKNGDAVTTYMLLTALQAHYCHADLTFVVGPDNLLKFGQFAHSEQILARWSVLGMPESVNVRSTYIRDRLAKGLPVDDLTTPSVAEQLSDTAFSFSD
ncbi:nicotinate-nicotinamide nucleotide adenylyltransferase [Salinivibrio sp. PR5]|uniref:nicotinate-nicotinamide nucleotide adenylyltransferase n=1 Tax=Salinivibrio sp. PR5 TaxID=1909484 RepID=UPI000989EA91|nr:nicotinate-nicotinamide nucleotide adenylyltransferase [Salinivibrio sp. PR5]OOF11156.1 nicotinate-nicotinamide nucleotide adenylyltransferase [Salinivibrio sp. PR5]